MRAACAAPIRQTARQTPCYAAAVVGGIGETAYFPQRAIGAMCVVYGGNHVEGSVELVAEGVGRGVGLASRADLRVEIRDVSLYRAHADAKRRCGLAIARTVGDQA